MEREGGRRRRRAEEEDGGPRAAPAAWSMGLPRWTASPERRQTFSRWQRIAREVGQYPSTQRLDRMEPSGLTSIPAQRRNEASRGAKGGHNERPAEGSKWAQGGRSAAGEGGGGGQ
ncbi:unnamed protein product [Prorocentrum cordatum]|uniref:Uncharacterized protein n=2 Tax=Prorocentrum cordatum TaxID=2364126 RepID=A0ABN9Y108_9DINO|nr:unnamed protein product [Polarella glacialis]